MNLMRYIFIFISLFVQVCYVAAQPFAICRNAAVYLDAVGQVTVSPSIIDGGSTNAVSYTINNAASITYTCSNIGANAVILGVTDAGGNTNTCSAIVTVADTIAPVLAVTNRTFALGPNGTVMVTPATFVTHSSDNCTIVSLLANGNSSLTYTCAHLDTNYVTLMATDASGNSTTALAMLILTDTTVSAQPALCRSDTLTVYLNTNDSINIQLPQIYTGTLPSYCWSFALNPATFSIANVGYNTVQLIASSSSYNDTCTVVVQVMNAVAVENLENTNFYSYISPNPVKDVLNLSYRLDTERSISVQLFNTLGEIMAEPIQTANHQSGEYTINIAMQHLPAGLYFLRVASEKGQEVHQVMKY
jgi:hypothetical protein